MTMPPLPEVNYLGDDVSYGYDACDMRAYGEACAAAERERCTHSELAEQCAVYARRIMELEKALGECSGALEHAGHPIEWQTKIDAAVAAERERLAKLKEKK